jgi:hypothetical protein
VELIGIEPNPGPKTGLAMRTLTITPTKNNKQRAKPRERKEVVVNTQRPAPKVSRNHERYLTGEVWNPRADMAMYMQTLMDAEKHPPVRLGGETMIQTALTQLHGTYTFTTTQASHSFVVHPRIWNPLLITGQAAAPYNYFAFPMFQASAVSQLAQLAAGARVVSAKLKVFTLSSATSDSGALVAGLSPRDDGFLNGEYLPAAISTTPLNTVSAGGFPIVTDSTNGSLGSFLATQGFNEFDDYDFTDVLPLKDGCSVFWLPEDPQTMTFEPDRIRQSTISSTFAVSPPTVATNNSSPIMDPFFVFGTQGAVVGSSIFIELYLNLEYTVTSGAAGVIDTSAGSMNTIQSFEVVRKVGGNLQNTVEPNPDASLGDKLGGAARSLARGGVGLVSKFLFGSSDIGNMVSDAIGFK